MARYTVTHTCGHTQTHELVGPMKDRERKLAWEAKGVCSDCYRQQRIAKEQEEAKKFEQNNAGSLPTLTGSEKQIAWAQSIRAKLLNDKYNPLSKQARTETDSRWFINNR